MKKQQLLTALVLGTLSSATAAIAQEKQNSFDGVNLGISGAYINESASATYNKPNATVDGKNFSSGGFGLTVGYGKTIVDKVYLGGAYDFLYVGTSDRKDASFDVSGIGTFHSSSIMQPGYMHSFSPVLGYQINVGENGVLMPYTKFGYTVQQANPSFDQSSAGLGHGFNVGGGLAYALCKHTAVFVEYNYIRSYIADKTVAASKVTDQILSSHIIKAGFSVRFDV